MFVGAEGSRHDLVLTLQSTWKPPDGRRTWCCAETAEGTRVGFWTRSKKAAPGATLTGSWEVERVKSPPGKPFYTQLCRPRGLKWSA